jgi:hypothetical protein
MADIFRDSSPHPAFVGHSFPPYILPFAPQSIFWYPCPSVPSVVKLSEIWLQPKLLALPAIRLIKENQIKLNQGESNQIKPDSPLPPGRPSVKPVNQIWLKNDWCGEK